MIPKHQRRNYEATSDLLNDLDCILVALDALEEAIPDREATRETNAAVKMRYLALDKIKEIEKARAAEWVGIGGRSENLSKAEIATARGEDDEVAQ